MKSIFSKLENYSDPLPTWLYEVEFYNDEFLCSAITLENTKNVVVTSITLPQYNTSTVVKKYFGQEKTYPILRTYGTDVTMNFDFFNDPYDNKVLKFLSQISSLEETPFVYTDDFGFEIENTYENREKYNFKKNLEVPDIHPEFIKYYNFDKNPKSFSTGITFFDKVKINVKTKELEDAFGILYKNCILTNFKFLNELSYNSDNKLSCSLTFHSDIWNFISNNEKINEKKLSENKDLDDTTAVDRLINERINEDYNKMVKKYKPNGNVIAGDPIIENN